MPSSPAFQRPRRYVRISWSTLARVRCAPWIVAAAILAGCSSAPEGYDAVPAAVALPGREGCPDLTGTFDVVGTPIAQDIDLYKLPRTHGLPLLITFEQGDTETKAWWVVPQRDLLTYAAELRRESPQRYAHWREQVLAPINLPQDSQTAIDAYRAAVSEAGPPHAVIAHLWQKQCKNNWMLVSEGIELAHHDGTRTFKLDHETWLARDKQGALLVKRLAFKVNPAISLPTSLRSTYSSEYLRFDAIPREAPTPLMASDLPELSAAPPEPTPTCTQHTTRAIRFFEQLSDRLPASIQLRRFSPVPPGTPDAQGACAGITVDIDIAGSDADFMNNIDAWLRSRNEVERVEALAPKAGDEREHLRRLRIVLTRADVPPKS